MTRKEAINILDDYDVNFEGHTAEEIAEAFDMAFKALEQEPKTGHWINKEHRKEEYVLIGKCSVCGRVRVLDEFCSNCGARMESEE